MTTSFNKIIVHDGRAHADEVFAVALAWVAGYVDKDTPYERRQPTEDELRNKSVLILDVGGRHEPDMGNFDHHQLPRGTVECAMSLLAKDAELHTILWHSPWYRALVMRDALGAMGMARLLGLQSVPPPEYLDLMQSRYVRMFEKTDHGVAGDLIIARDVLKDEIAASKKLIGRLRDINEFPIINYDGIRCMVLPDSDTFGLNVWTRQNQGTIDMSTGPDLRDPESYVSLYRYNDRVLDFSRLEGNQGVRFAHKGGFLAIVDRNLDIGDFIKRSKI